MINLRLPKVDAPTPQGQVKQLQAYLQQLVPELQLEFERLERENQSLKESIEQQHR